jgi:hypothetical protein
MVLVVLLRQDRNPGIRDSINLSTAQSAAASVPPGRSVCAHGQAQPPRPQWSERTPPHIQPPRPPTRRTYAVTAAGETDHRAGPAPDPPPELLAPSRHLRDARPGLPVYRRISAGVTTERHLLMRLLAGDNDVYAAALAVLRGGATAVPECGDQQ